LAVTRQTYPPSQPVLEAPMPVYRGTAPNQPASEEYSNPSIRPATPSASYNQPQQYYAHPQQSQQSQGGISLGAPQSVGQGIR
jgi:hypothetical protein